MEVSIELDLIDPNPWQPRQEENNQHVWETAQSIQKWGLLQAPTGRMVGERVQLAFGHTRLAAFKMLREQSGETKWNAMPVVLRSLADVEMFEASLVENLHRNNLNPIEEALAMERYRDEFGKTSEEIGKLFNMGDSGVRNKMRLLNLPESIQGLVRRREMAEGTARELLAIYELPDDVRSSAEDDDEFLKPSEIIEAAKSGTSQKAVAEMVYKFMEHIGKRQPKAAPAPEPDPAPAYNPAPAPEPLATFQPSRPATVTVAVQPAQQPTVQQFQETAKQAAQVFEAQPADAVSTETVQPAPSEELANETQPPAAEPAPAETWETAEITLTLTWWPQDEHPEGRLIMGGVVVKGKPQPVFRMYRDQTLVMGDQLADLLEEARNKYFGGAS